MSEIKNLREAFQVGDRRYYICEDRAENGYRVSFCRSWRQGFVPKVEDIGGLKNRLEDAREEVFQHAFNWVRGELREATERYTKAMGLAAKMGQSNTDYFHLAKFMID